MSVTYLHAKVHVVAFVARVPDKTIRPTGPEDDFERLAVASSVVLPGQQFEVIHDPRVAVEVSPAVTIRRGRCRRCKVDDRLRRHVIKQILAIEVEVTHVSVEGRPFLQT